MRLSKKIISITSPLLTEANAIAKQHQHYVGEFVTRGHQELYKVLANMYAVCVTVENHSHKDAIVKQMRQLLKEEHGIKTTSKTEAMAVVIRYITHATPKTVSVYKRVFTSALANGINKEGLSDYITINGGIDKCGKAIANAELAINKRLALKALKAATTNQLLNKPAIAQVQFGGVKKPSLPIASDVAFTHLICAENFSTGELEVVHVAYPDSEIERRALEMHNICCKAASLSDKSLEFYEFCAKHGLNMDILHRWMKVHGMTNSDDAKEEISRVHILLSEQDALKYFEKKAA